MFKKVLSTVLCAFMILGVFGTTALAADSIKLVIDGKEVKSDVAPVVENGTTLVPVRVVSENLGADVAWDEAKGQATIKTAAYTVVFTVNSKDYTVNGTKKTMSVAAKSINGRTMIPIRAFSEAINADVNYDNKTNTASVDYFTKMTGTIKISGSTTVQPIAQAAADKLLSMNKGLSITVAGGGSGAGINDTKSGANNIGMSSSSIKPEDATVVNPFVVANDAIAIIVHPDNPVKNLTKEQAAKIFLGEIKNWNEVGGNNAPITIHTRETGSGTLATLEELLLSKQKVVERATPYTSAALLKNAVAKDKNGIGFDSIGFVDNTVKALSLNNVAASSKTVNNGTYPLSRSLYVFTKGNATGVNAMFIDYLKSLDCQQNIVVKEGYVAIEK